MRKTLLSLIMLTALVAFSVTQAEAATTADIAVTVTLETVSVSVAPTSWAPTGVTAAVTSPTFTATNDCITGTETLSIICGAGGTWAISGIGAGANTFVMKATGGLLSATSIDTSQTLQTGVAAGGTVNFTLEFTPPTSSTVGSDSMTVTVTAS